MMEALGSHSSDALPKKQTIRDKTKDAGYWLRDYITAIKSGR